MATRKCALSLALWIAALAVAAAESHSVDVAGTWPVATPEEVGVDSSALVEMIEFAREQKTPVHSVQLVRHGRLVLDAYFHPYNDRIRHDVASVTKSITSTLIGLAIAKGHVRDVNQPILSFFPGRDVTFAAQKSKLTLEHLLTMQSGFDCGVEMNNPRINVDTRLDEMRRSANWIQYALDMPIAVEPGTRFRYCNANCHLLSAIITRATGTNALGFARREWFEPLGIRDVAWPADPHGNNYGWGDLQIHPRDMAKLGQLFLQRGRWGERQVIPERWIETATRPHVEQTGGNDQYGYLWWIPGPPYPGVFEAIGRGGQRITVWPAKKLVLVYTGGGFNPDDLTKFILKSLKSDNPLPANPEMAARLRDRLDAARQPHAPQSLPKLPEIAVRVSSKTYAFSANSLDLGELVLRFDKSAEAKVRFKRLGQELRCPIGLDGVERFSTDTLVELPFACKGQWLSTDTFLLELDRVAGVSCYRFRLTFGKGGKTLSVALNERTGLNEETFTGKATE